MAKAYQKPLMAKDLVNELQKLIQKHGNKAVKFNFTEATEARDEIIFCEEFKGLSIPGKKMSAECEAFVIASKFAVGAKPAPAPKSTGHFPASDAAVNPPVGATSDAPVPNEEKMSNEEAQAAIDSGEATIPAEAVMTSEQVNEELSTAAQ